MDRGSHQPLEFPGQMVFADKKTVGQFIQGQIFIVVFIDITQNIVNRGIWHRHGFFPALLLGLLSWLPILGVIFVILGSLLDLYALIGIALAILNFFNLLK